MKKLTSTLTAILLVTTTVGFSATLASAKGNPNAECVRIQDGILETSGGDVITTGYMDSGYNYQAHQFNGDWGGDALVMKWSESWLGNKDCDDDGALDRHAGFPTYIGSGAWLTNHFSGEYVDTEGKTQHWTSFIKIVAAPEDATLTDGVWYNVEGGEIGPVIWGQFAILQDMLNDSGTGEHGVLYKSPTGPGLGNI